MLIAIASVTYHPLPKGLRQWGLVAALGATNRTLGLGFMFLGAARLSTGVASVLANAQPLLIVLPAWWLYRERPHKAGHAGLGVGVGGLLFVAVSGGAGSGAAFAIGSAVAATAGTLLARRLGALDNVVAAGWSFQLGAAGLALWALLDEGLPVISFTAGFVADLGFLAVAGTAGVYVVWFAEARRCPLYRLASWTLAVPVFGLLAGVAIEGDRPDAWTASGLVVMLVGLCLVLRRDRHHRVAQIATSSPNACLPSASFSDPPGTDRRPTDPIRAPTNRL